MSAYSYVLGLVSGLAILVFPSLVLGACPTDAAARWIAGLGDPEPEWFDLAEPEVERPAAGYQPGDPTPEPLMPPPTLQPVTPPGAAPATPSEPADPDATPEAEATPTPTPETGEVERMRVANTDGVGVAFRASPRMDDRVPHGLLEGVEATVLEREGDDWARVRADDGREGWVPTRYLEPVD